MQRVLGLIIAGLLGACAGAQSGDVTAGTDVSHVVEGPTTATSVVARDGEPAAPDAAHADQPRLLGEFPLPQPAPLDRIITFYERNRDLAVELRVHAGDDAVALQRAPWGRDLDLSDFDASSTYLVTVPVWTCQQGHALRWIGPQQIQVTMHPSLACDPGWFESLQVWEVRRPADDLVALNDHGYLRSGTWMPCTHLDDGNRRVRSTNPTCVAFANSMPAEPVASESDGAREIFYYLPFPTFAPNEPS